VTTSLNGLLAIHPTQMSSDTYTERQQDCIEALKKATEQIGESPTVQEYVELGLRPSQNTIKKAFGTWNAAKEAAGLSLRSIEGHTRVNINETYFKTIDSDEKAYWLGCLFCNSSINESEQAGRAMQLGRTADKRHYVEGFAEAVDSEYAINEFETSDSTQVSMGISNQEFLNVLADHGLTDSAKQVEEYPEIPEKHEHAFIRAILENRGNVAGETGGWIIRGGHESQLEYVQEWVESAGVKRSTLSEKTNGTPILYISNTFDAATVFEAAWPDRLDTTPTHRETAQKYAERIAEEHQFPENLSFTPINESEPGTGTNDDTTSQSDEEVPSRNTSGFIETTSTEVSEETEPSGATNEVTVPLSLDVAVLIDTLATIQKLEASEIVTKALQAYLGGLLAGDAPEPNAHGTTADVVDRSLTIPPELLSIIDESSKSIPLRTIIESSVQYEYGEASDTVDVEVPSSKVDDVPTNTDPIAKSLSGLLSEE